MKKAFISVVLMFVFTYISVMGTSYYVATNGSDSNSGTSTSSPFKTLEKAINVVAAGDYIYLRGGTYVVSTTPIIITKNGTSSANINVFAYSSEVPVLQFNNVENSSNRGIVMDGDYWHWKGITIERAGDNGMLLSGNNNTIENCIFRKNHDTGLQLSRYSSSATSISQWPSNNLIIGCESYDNQDSGNENADGFAAKLTCGTGNVFRNCVSHHNIDDGWDLYTKSDTGPIGAIIFENCIAHDNGTLTDGSTSGGGDKNGFKLGSSSNTVNHVLYRCIAYNNGKHGFTDNGNIGSIKFYNLTSYNNGDYNYHTRDGASHVFRNCITLNGNHTDRIVGDAPTSCNGLDDTDTQWSIVVTSSDFQTLTPGPNANPTSNGFLQLKSSSQLIDRGCSVSGITYNGSAPDLGAIEYGGTTTTNYTLTTNVSGSGSVNPSSGTYASGSAVTLTATPSSGWTFSNWSGDASGSSNPVTITMNSNKSVTAVFTQTTTTNYTLATSVVGQGTVSPSSGTYASGTSVTLTATPASGYVFSGWSGDASGTSTSVTITMDSNKSVVAIFTASGSGGSVTRIEDTDAGTISYDGSLKSYSAAGNGTAINLSNSSGMRIVWNYNTSSAGTYTLTLRYTRKSTMNSSVNIIVNGGSATTLSLPVTASSAFATVSMSASLVSGMNTIILQTNAGGESADVDWIEISGGTSTPPPTSVTLTIQENETGFCSVDGTVDSNNAGYTGSGFANTNNASGYGITWSVNIPSAGSYSLACRYSNGGTTDRTGQLMIDGSTVVSSISMPATGSWTTWTTTSSTTVNLSAGNRLIRLQATNSSGLANIDYINITGINPTAVSCSGLKTTQETLFAGADNIKIYPNPVKGGAIKISGNLEAGSDANVVVIYDELGRVVITKNLGVINKGDFEQSVGVEGLRSGMYFIRMIMNSGAKTMPFIKE